MSSNKIVYTELWVCVHTVSVPSIHTL